MDPRTIRRWAAKIAAVGCPYDASSMLARCWVEGFLAAGGNLPA